MQIGVLTYEGRHRKTYDTLCLLKAKGYEDVEVYAVPFHYKKTFQPLFQHRPEMVIDYPEIHELCKSFQYRYNSGKDITEFEIKKERVLLLCGAGLLPQSFIDEHTIINAHPGYIPNARGLDALKWAIVEAQPIGVTTHLLGKEVDAGEIIERQIISVQYTDTFHAVAQRVYDTEIKMLVNAVNKLTESHEYIEGGDYPIHRRMPHSMELQLLEKFDDLKKNILN